jgi:hypothetical protein
VSVADVVAGDWIVLSDADEPVQLHWRTGYRSPDGRVGWSLKTSGGLRLLGENDRVVRLRSEATSTDVAAVEVEPEHDTALEAAQALTLDEEKSAELSLVHAVLVGVAVSIPVAIVIWVGLVALAVGGDNPDWLPWLGMAAAIGILNGVFFGALAGFVMKAHTLDDVDRHSTQVVESARAHLGDPARH